MAHELLIKYGVNINNTQVITGVTTEVTLAQDSDYLLATEHAVKGYVDTQIASATTASSGYSLILYNQSTGYTDQQISIATGYTDQQFNSATTYSYYLYNLSTGYTDMQISGITVDLTEYVTTGTSQHITGTKTFDSVVYMLNGLYVSGTTTYLNTQNLNVFNNYIYINSGETGTGVTAGAAGIVVKRGTSADYLIQWDESQDNFRVGSTGQTQAVATREDSPTNGYIATWDAGTFKFITTLNPATLATIIYVQNNFLSANTSFYTQAEANANFLSSNTSYYTQTQANANFLSASTSFYTQAQADANFLSSNTSFYTQAQANANFLSADTSSLISKYSATGSNIFNIDTFVNTLGIGVVWHYAITDVDSGGTNRRTGTIQATYTTGSTVEFTDTSTLSIGNVTCELNVTNTGNVSLNSVATGNWTIKVTRIILG